MKRSIISKFLCAILAVSLLSGCSLISGLMPTEPTQPQTPPDFSGIVDFVIHAEEGREFRILQITDTQIEDASKDRIPDRITDSTPLTEEELYSDVFYYIDEAVKEAQPDLILMTGDNIAGMFDDDGWCTLQLVDFMESLEIPWAPIFGNHDNETAMGVTWQCQQFENAENCLFKRGDITGNSNYTIGIEQGGNVIKILYMMDSNGCQFGYTYSPLPSFGTINAGEKIKESNGFAEDQVQWIADTSAKITDGLGYTPSKFLAIHINLKEYFILHMYL